MILSFKLYSRIFSATVGNYMPFRALLFNSRSPIPEKEFPPVENHCYNISARYAIRREPNRSQSREQFILFR